MFFAMNRKVVFVIFAFCMLKFAILLLAFDELRGPLFLCLFGWSLKQRIRRKHKLLCLRFLLSGEELGVVLIKLPTHKMINLIL